MAELALYMNPDANRGRSCGVSRLACTSSESCFSGIIGQTPEDATLLFGYTHRKSFSYRSSPLIFSKEIISELKKKGYKNLVLEIFPVGERGSLIERELATFNRTGRVGVEMMRFLPYLDKESFLELLKSAFSGGIKIYAGGVNYDSVNDTILNPNMDENVFATIVSQINQNSFNVISSLRDKGEKCAFLGGASHNNLSTLVKSDLSFAKRLEEVYPDKIYEIDMVLPENSDSLSFISEMPIPRECNWRDFVPDYGVSAVSTYRHTYLMFWHPEE